MCTAHTFIFSNNLCSNRTRVLLPLPPNQQSKNMYQHAHSVTFWSLYSFPMSTTQFFLGAQVTYPIIIIIVNSSIMFYVTLYLTFLSFIRILSFNPPPKFKTLFHSLLVFKKIYQEENNRKKRLCGSVTLFLFIVMYIINSVSFCCNKYRIFIARFQQLCRTYLGIVNIIVFKSYIVAEQK